MASVSIAYKVVIICKWDVFSHLRWAGTCPQILDAMVYKRHSLRENLHVDLTTVARLCGFDLHG